MSGIENMLSLIIIVLVPLFFIISPVMLIILYARYGPFPPLRMTRGYWITSLSLFLASLSFSALADFLITSEHPRHVLVQLGFLSMLAAVLVLAIAWTGNIVSRG